ncbi:MAG: dihydrodipicolinate synthase family protein [Betaproteobacteria bacterium]|nr:dihydrodipicolinate synthase family protein [Betaproteobacteria bacterium]
MSDTLVFSREDQSVTPKNASAKFRGIAMITAVPFNDRGEFNAPEYRRLIEHQINGGIRIVQCPLAEEIYYMSDDECWAVMKTLAESTKGSGALSCAIASHSPSVATIIDNVKRYQDFGIDVIKLLAPLHYGLDFGQQQVYDYYASVLAVAKVPVMLYNQPKRCGVNVSVEVITRLAREFEHVVMLEETNFNQVARIKALAGKTISIYNKFPFWLAGAAMSCEGFYARTPFIPRQVQELYELWETGRHDEAIGMFFDRYDLYALSTPGDSVAALKYALELIGFRMGGVRAPLESDVSQATRQAFAATLSKHGLVKK